MMLKPIGNKIFDHPQYIQEKLKCFFVSLNLLRYAGIFKCFGILKVEFNGNQSTFVPVNDGEEYYNLHNYIILEYVEDYEFVIVSKKYLEILFCRLRSNSHLK